MKNYYVYIITNKKYGTLYIGVTSNLSRRIYEHKNKLIDGFSKKYSLNRLVYFLETDDVNSAIMKEKQIKKWKREYKINVINEQNPDWKDLYLEILE